MIRYGSVCSGIEAATMGWHGLGWEPAFFSEIDPAPRAVLSHHYPHVPLHGDFTTIGADDYGPIDLLVGGTPCQSFSIAGLRGGLADARGNLALEFLRLARRKRARWLVWENVPGAFSAVSHAAPDYRPPEIDLDAGDGPEDGEEIVVEDSYDADEDHAFACFLAGLSELGYGWAYRVLDAQHFGVPQRRRREFLVGYLGDWRRAAAVLFERHSLQGHSPPRRQTGEGITASPGGIAGTCSSKWAKGSGGPAGDEHYNLIAHSLRAEGFDASEDGTGRGTPLVPVAFDMRGRDGGAQMEGPHDTANMRAASGGSSRSYIAFDCKASGQNGFGVGEVMSTLRSMGHANSHTNGGGHASIRYGSAVRRLTPRECERLQGFPDDFTLVPYRKGMMADGPRYKMLGNSMAVPCMRWIGERIQTVELAAQHQEAA